MRKDFEKYLLEVSKTTDRIRLGVLITNYEASHAQLSYNGYKATIKRCLFRLRRMGSGKRYWVFFKFKKNCYPNIKDFVLTKLNYQAKKPEMEELNRIFMNLDNKVKCSTCGIEDTEIIQIHHIDCNRKNNKIENLSLLCANCHYRLHRTSTRTTPQNIFDQMKNTEIPNFNNTTIPSSNVKTTVIPLAPPPLALGTGHHLLWVGSYKGEQPTSLESYRYGTNDCNSASIFRVNNVLIRIHKHRFEVYCNAIVGDTTDEIKGKAWAQGRLALANIAREHGLTVDWGVIERRFDLHINFTLPTHQKADTLVMEAVRREPVKAREELGMLAGDRSHPDQVEFTGKAGENSFDALSFAIKQMPLLAAGFKEYNENIRSHLAAIRELRSAVRELRDAVKEKRRL